IYGTPVEVTTKRLEITVTDSSVPPQSRTQSFWVSIKGGSGIVLVDSMPRITAGGFSNGYLVAGPTPQTLPVTAEVTDLTDDVVSVKLYDKFGVEQASLTHGSGNTWSGTFQILQTVAGRKTWYTMRAQDSAGNLSVPWPYMVVDGGPGEEHPTFFDG